MPSPPMGRLSAGTAVSVTCAVVGSIRNAVVDDGEVQLIAVDFGSKWHGVGVRMVYYVGHGLFHG